MVFKADPTKAKKESKKETAAVPTEAPKPIRKAFSIERTDKGMWILHIEEIQDGKVISTKSSEPEPKSLAVERFKLGFAHHYIIGKN